MSDNSKPLVIVLGFFQTFERVPVKGDELTDEIDDRGFKLDARGRRIMENVATDWVTYAPAHSPLHTGTSDRVRHLQPNDDLLSSENGEKKLFIQARWAAIEPHYEAWKANYELPISGTPLAQWPGVSTAMADELKRYSIRTVEDVRDIAESMIDRIRLPNMRSLRDQARAFLENVRVSEAATREVERDEEIAALKAAMAEQQAAMAEQQEQLIAAMALLEEKAAGDSSELDDLRKKLDDKGVKYHHKAGVDTLKALLAEAA
jgi:hypothetical protein